jgi:LPS O-antigen subunit length determinant protein (WzzB/FepE family)
MTENDQISNNPPDDEIKFIDILGFLVLNKNLILSIISFFTLSSVIYCFSVTPIYKATISFMPSQEFHISEPLVKKRLSQIQQSIFKQFIDQMISLDLQQKVATEGGFLEKFKDGPNDTSDIPQLISRVNNSITTSPVHWKTDINLMSPTTVAMTGKDPKVISDFLNALSEAGIKTAQNKTFELIEEANLKTSQLIEEANLKASQALKELIPDDQFNINVIEQEIKILSKQAKAIRLRKIKILEDHLKVATNFTALEQNELPLDPFRDFAFLNGEKKIQALINTLKKRTNDDLYTPRIIELQELLEAYKNNQISHRPSARATYSLPLRNLKRVESKISFDEKIKQLKVRKRNLKKRPEVIIVSRKSFLPQEPIAPEKTKIITCAIIVGLFFGIFIAILRSGLRILKKSKVLGSP